MPIKVPSTNTDNTTMFRISLPRKKDTLVQMRNRWLELVEKFTQGNQAEFVRSFIDDELGISSLSSFFSGQSVTYKTENGLDVTAVISYPKDYSEPKLGVTYNRTIQVLVTMQMEDEEPSDREKREKRLHKMTQLYADGSTSKLFRMLMTGELLDQMWLEKQRQQSLTAEIVKCQVLMTSVSQTQTAILIPDDGTQIKQSADNLQTNITRLLQDLLSEGLLANSNGKHVAFYITKGDD